MKDKKSTSSAFLIFDHRVCLSLRDNVPHIVAPGKWALPGGHIQNGESRDEALKRELQEEVNIIPANIIYIGQYIDYEKTPHFIYFAKLSNDEKNAVKLGEEGQKLKFFGFGDLIKLKLEKTITDDFDIFKEDGLKQLLEKESSASPEFLGLHK